jgi:pyruvate ferredoxin oxidoreductase gamma subunit
LIIINTDHDVLNEDDIKVLEDLNATVVQFDATALALKIAGTELATNMAMMGMLLGLTKLVTTDNIEAAVRERFLGTSFVSSGGTAMLDSAIEKKFKKKEQLLEANMNVIKKTFEMAEQVDISGDELIVRFSV